MGKFVVRVACGTAFVYAGWPTSKREGAGGLCSRRRAWEHFPHESFSRE